MYFMKIVTVYTLNSHLLILKEPTKTSPLLSSSAKCQEASFTNSVDPDQTAPVGAVCL